MATRKTSLPTKNHVLAVSARLFLAQGYHDTTIREIAAMAGVSVSSVQNFFRSKEGLLCELVPLMFNGQFRAARQAAPVKLSPMYIYAAETALQLVLTEQNENLREIYLEAYTAPETVEFIHQNTARELMQIFGDRFPDYELSDFYELDIGSSGLMRSYMARPCDIHFSMQRKIERFLSSSLCIYRVSEEEIGQVLAFVRSLDLEAAAEEVVQRLFAMLEAYFDSELSQSIVTA